VRGGKRQVQRRAAFWLGAYGRTILLPGAVVDASAVVALARVMGPWAPEWNVLRGPLTSLDPLGVPRRWSRVLPSR
jgi:hypothetical protein